MNLLVTGFLPFGGETRNPSGEIAARLSGGCAGGLRLESVVLPVERRSALRQAREAVRRLRPAAVLALGLGATRAVIGVERFARNLDDYATPDEAGEQPRGEVVVAGGPELLRATLPEEEIARAIRAAGVPGAVSDDAGTFLCNHVYYGLLHGEPAAGLAPCPALFLHLPPLPESVAARGEVRASMPLELSERGVRAALERIAVLLRGTVASEPAQRVRGDEREQPRASRSC